MSNMTEIRRIVFKLSSHYLQNMGRAENPTGWRADITHADYMHIATDTYSVCICSTLPEGTGASGQ